MTRLPLGRAHALATRFGHELRQSVPAIESLTPVGGLRRYSAHVDDVALLALAPPPLHDEIFTAVTHLPTVTDVVSRSPTHLTVRTEGGDLTVHATAQEHAGTSLVWLSGRRAHVERLVRRARRRGLAFDGKLYRNGVAIEVGTELELYETLGLPLIPPELRRGGDEIEAAVAGRLPRLLETPDIRGDLHMHTAWSDGRDSIGEMAAAARRLGYEYIAITDHSQRALSSRKLSREDIARQRADLEEVRVQQPGLEILHGVEVDIMPDGSLDFDDDVLAQFDIVLASLHVRAGQDGARLTERYLAAVRHPLVNVITHPANRSPVDPVGYDIDFDRLFQAAADTGTALEIDGGPSHLDLRGGLARRAAALGVTLTVDSDAHRADWLSMQMQFGIGTARRGWVEPGQVLNTRGVEAVRAFVSEKRSARRAQPAEDGSVGSGAVPVDAAPSDP